MNAPRAPGAAPVPPSRDDRATLRLLGLPMIGLLVVEFLLGMTLNLYGTLPTGAPLSVLLADPVLIVHIVVGVLLVGITSRATVLGARLHERRAFGAGLLGLLSTLVASLAGLAFTFGGQDPNASLTMSAGFAGILVSAVMLRTSSIVPETPRAGRPAEPPGERDPGGFRSV